MRTDGMAVACPLGVAENALGLDALRFGFERAMEIACGWVATTPETALKIQLGKVIWHCAVSADLIATRLDELQALTPHPKPSGALYTAFTNALLEVEDSRERMALLHGLVLPDLRSAVRAHAGRVRSLSDSLTDWALSPLESRLEALLAGDETWKPHHTETGPAEGEAATRARELFRASGGVAGPQAGELSEPLAALARQAVVPQAGGLADTPAREARLRVIDPVGPGPTSFAMFVHSTIFNIEIPATEVCARIIIEHGDAPWKLKLDMARQVYDEVRHAEILLARLTELGASVGDFPIDLRVWRSFRAGESLAEQLMLQQRIGEGGGLDGGDLVRRNSEQQGDERTARIFEYINADEINHVRIGNKWIRYLLNHDEAAVSELERKACEKLVAIGCRRPPLKPWVQGRRLAAFTDKDLRVAVATWQEFEKRQQVYQAAAVAKP